MTFQDVLDTFRQSPYWDLYEVEYSNGLHKCVFKLHKNLEFYYIESRYNKKDGSFSPSEFVIIKPTTIECIKPISIECPRLMFGEDVFCHSKEDIEEYIERQLKVYYEYEKLLKIYNNKLELKNIDKDFV